MIHFLRNTIDACDQPVHWLNKLGGLRVRQGLEARAKIVARPLQNVMNVVSNDSVSLTSLLSLLITIEARKRQHYSL
jgi:hypothetical protein